MIVCEGKCRCPEIDWIKPLDRVLHHFTHFGPEICPDCKTEIDWIRGEEE